MYTIKYRRDQADPRLVHVSIRNNISGRKVRSSFPVTPGMTVKDIEATLRQLAARVSLDYERRR